MGGRRLSEENKQAIRNLRDQGMTYTAIGHRFNIQASTAYRVALNIKQGQGGGSDRPGGSGRRHVFTNIREADRLADCSICGPDIKISFRKRSNSWECNSKAEITRARYGNAARRRLGVRPSDYEAMVLSQCGTCAICGGINEDGRSLAVDHCHETGRVRGLLCGRCNTALGLMRDDTTRLR